MDRLQIYRLMGVPPAGIFITGVQILLWGRKVVLTCLYDPEAPRRFRVTFEACAGIRWDAFEDEIDERDVEADVIGFLVGENDHGRPAIITTDLFELSVSYGTMIISTLEDAA
ncbi:MAG TPA: hypothetical protein PKD09_23045 [Aggregatilinea sp.]|uniref:hypothetical protein n=1 Tax=Aggregatilinea sp. TaxID=2806333 RepID=UPI002C3C45A0|nr:hypothetical protein [Aggregatilinea sp.]HML24548.1 hypothetical protein [Aggregatilinea sp.]